MSNTSILHLIQSGAQDHELDALYEAIRNRRERKQDVEAAQFRAALTEGQEVWFNDKTRPQYLQGRRCKVIEINRVRVVVRLVNGSPGGRFHGNITTDVGLLTNVKPKYAVD